MSLRLANLHLFCLLLLTFLLCQCAEEVNSTEPVLPVVKPHKPIETPYKLSAATYLNKAKNQEGEEKQHFLLLAAGQLIAQYRWQQGLAILAQTTGLTPTQQDERHLLEAQVAVLRDDPKGALAQLLTIQKPDALSLYQQIQLHQAFARSYDLTKQYTLSIAERIKLQTLLVNERAQVNNSRALWLSLMQLNPKELDALAAEATPKSELRGWAELALLPHHYPSNKSLVSAIDDWQSHHVEHPANHLLPHPLDLVTNKLFASPKQVALLLPLSGPFAGPGHAIQDGFMAAHKAANSTKPLAVKSYDTNKQDIHVVYEQAIKEGAEYVVGPLIKSQVAAIAKNEHPIPTLLLNDTEVVLENNSYLFSLSPTYEAKQVALRARQQGLSRALIIAPQNDWGNEIVKAFKTKWEKKGATVSGIFSYTPGDNLAKKMQDFLEVTNSLQRERQLKELLGQSLQVGTSRRQDFDMIFLLAYPKMARQLMPLLKYYYAGDVPVYATSAVYTGAADPIKDKDLDGLIFCDIPWVFSHQLGTRNWPEQFNGYNRLYALGHDSYKLSTQLNQLILFSVEGSKGASSALYLSASQQVTHPIEWGQFNQGLPHSLSPMLG